MALDIMPAQQDIKKALIQHCGSYCTVCDGHLSDSLFLRHPPSVACSLHLSPFSAHQPMTHYSSRVCTCMWSDQHNVLCVCVCVCACAHFPISEVKFHLIKTQKHSYIFLCLVCLLCSLHVLFTRECSSVTDGPQSCVFI